MDYDSSRPFQGVVEMDGVYVNGYIRPRNKLEKKKAQLNLSGFSLINLNSF